MSSKWRDADYLGDVLEAMQRIRAYTEGLSSAQFMEDCRTQDAIVRNIEIIGEAVKQLSASLRKKHPAVPWKDMAGMRDKAIHHYFGINYDTIWTAASKEVPDMEPKIRAILKNLER